MEQHDYIKKANMQLPYTIINNSVSRSRILSFESKGILFCLLTLPPDWVVNKSWILKNFPIRRRALDRVFIELEDNGFICSFNHEKVSGKYSGKGYIIYAESVNDNYDPKDALTDVQNEQRLKTKKSIKSANSTVVRLPTSVNVQLQIQKVTNTKSNSLQKIQKEIVSEEEIFKRFEQAEKTLGKPGI